MASTQDKLLYLHLDLLCVCVLSIGTMRISSLPIRGVGIQPAGVCGGEGREVSFLLKAICMVVAQCCQESLPVDSS